MGEWDDKFERHAGKWASWNMQEYAQHDRVLTKIIEDKARRNPDHVVFQFGDDPLTLGELNEAINMTANGLASLGVKHGDKVAIMLPNCPEFLYTWFALNKIGACEVPVNVALKGQGLSYQMVQHTATRKTFCGSLESLIPPDSPMTAAYPVSTE